MSNKDSKNLVKARKQELRSLLRELGKRTYDEVNEGKFPQFVFPSRSVSNIVYDSRLKQYILGKTNVKRSAGNIKHIRPFTQLLWLAFFADRLVKEGKTSTLRDVYYSSQADNMEFVDQAESDEIITDLESLLTKAREDFMVYPEDRSEIFGDLTIEYTVPGYEGQRLNLSSHPDGYAIGPSLSTAQFVDTSAEMVIAVEKGGIFTRFVQEKVHKKYKAIIIDTNGQAPRSTRFMLKRLNKELNLPVYLMTDGDVYGEHIAMVVISGSVSRDEPIVVKDERGVKILKIGEFVDDCIEKFGWHQDIAGNEVCSGIPYEVLTVDNENHVVFKPMTAAIRHLFTGRLIELRTQSGRSVVVTPNHSVFLLRNERIASLPTSEIRKGDLLVMGRQVSEASRPTISVDVARNLIDLSRKESIPELYLIFQDTRSKYHSRRRLETFATGKKKPHVYQRGDVFISARRHALSDKCPARIWLTKEFARLLGYYISEGYIGTVKGVARNVNFTFGLHEPDVIEDAQKCVKSMFPYAHVGVCVDQKGNSATVNFGGTPTALLFKSLCGSGFAHKHIPAFLFSADKEYLLEFLKGCFGDGYVTNSGGLCWKMKNPGLIAELAYLMMRIGIIASIGKNHDTLIVSGKAETEQLVQTILQEDDRNFVLEHIASTQQSSYLLPKAFPVLSTGIAALKSEIMRHQYHDVRCKLTFRRICGILQLGRDGGIDRKNLLKTFDHVQSCRIRPPTEEIRAKISTARKLVESDISFDPVVDIIEKEECNEYVYDVSVPVVERFIGGRSGILLHNSANAAHLRELTVPTAKWVGVWASDIVKFKLPTDQMTEADIKRAQELKKDPRYTSGVWQRELDVFLKIKRKSELEAFSKYGLTFIVDTYLKEKMQEAKSL